MDGEIHAIHPDERPLRRAGYAVQASTRELLQSLKKRTVKEKGRPSVLVVLHEPEPAHGNLSVV
jgi:hypothetical protein